MPSPLRPLPWRLTTMALSAWEWTSEWRVPSWSIPASGNILTESGERNWHPVKICLLSALLQFPQFSVLNGVFRIKQHPAVSLTHTPPSLTPSHTSKTLSQMISYEFLCLPTSKPSSHCQVSQLSCELIRTPNILTRFKTFCPSLTKYSVWS